MLMVDRQGRIVMVNAEIERLFGYDREELVGESIEILLPVRARHAHVAMRLGFLQALEARPMGKGRDLPGLCKDGTEIRVEIGLNPVRMPEGDFVLGSVVDVTERLRGEEEREQLLIRFKSLNAELTRSLSEREVLLQEVHHRVKNNLQVVSSLINMQVRKLDSAAARDALEECQTRVQAIALIHEQLYQSKDYARVPFSQYCRRLAATVFDTLGTSRSSVRLELAIEDVALAVDLAIPCGLILNELITNALKHGFPEGRAGQVRVELRRSPDGLLHLAVEDDGVGLADRVDVARSASLGLQLIRTLTEQLDGQLEVERTPKTAFRLTFREGRAT